MNRDMVPRIFSRRGLRYAAGYCGSGVVWARWAGEKAAKQILGEETGRSALDFRPAARCPALCRQGLVHAGGLRLADAAGQACAPQELARFMRPTHDPKPQLRA